MADKKGKRIKILVGILIIISLFVILQNNNLLPLAIGSGFDVLGISNVQFNSNDPTIGGQAWVLTVSQNGAGQSVYGDFGTISDNSGKSSNPFTLTLSLDKNYATYRIFNQDVFIKTITWTKVLYNPFSSRLGCDSSWSNSQKVQGIYTYCYNYANKGVYGTLNDADLNFQSTISVQGDGGTDKIIISNDKATSGISQNGNIRASWFGSFSSGESAPSPFGQGIVAVYDTSIGGWRTASQTNYDTWRTYDISGLKSCFSTTSNADTCFQTYNNYATSFMNGKQFTTTGGSVATTSGTQSNGLVTMNLPKQLQFPGITMKIKALFIGINIPVGKPKILSADSLTFQTGQTGNIAVVVQNIGDGAGSFDVYASCSAGFSQTGGSLRISSLSPSLSQTVYIPITSNVVSGTKQGTCTVTARDVNNPNNVDTKTVTVSSSAIIICTEGQVSIIANKIQECKNNVWVTIKECLPTEEAKIVDGVASCVPIKSGGECKWYNPICQFQKLFSKIGDFFKGIFDFTGGILGILRSVVVLIVGIFGTLFGKDLISSFRALRRKEWLAWILALIIGLGLAYFVWKVFWVGLIIFVIFIILKQAIKFTPLGRVLKR